MRASSGHTFVAQDEVSAESQVQINELRWAIRESTLKLEEVQQRRLRVEEEIVKRTKETERRVDLMMEKNDIVIALQHLGHQLQREMHLFKQLNDESSPDRNEWVSLQDRSESAKMKANHLVAEILQVKQQLEEVEARLLAVQARLPVPACKSESNPMNQ